MTEKFRNQIQIEMDTALDTARNTALALAGFKAHGNMPDRAALNRMLKQILEGNLELMGLWTVWEPNALDGKDEEFKGTEGHDDTGRYIAYWNRVGGLHLEPCVEYEDGATTGYYTYPRATGKEMVTEPVAYEIGGKMVTVVSASVPVMHNGKFVGLVGADFSMDKMHDLVTGIKAYDTGYGALITDTGVFAAHPKKDLVGKHVKEFFSAKTVDALSRGEEASEAIISAVTGKETGFAFLPLSWEKPGKPGTSLSGLPLTKSWPRQNPCETSVSSSASLPWPCSSVPSIILPAPSS